MNEIRILQYCRNYRMEKARLHRATKDGTEQNNSCDQAQLIWAGQVPFPSPTDSETCTSLLLYRRQKAAAWVHQRVRTFNLWIPRAIDSPNKPFFNSRLSLILKLGKRMECSPNQALQGSAVCQSARHVIGISVTKLLTRLDYIFAITTLILFDACNNSADK